MTTKFTKAFTSAPKLPIPYIDSIEVHTDNIIVQAIREGYVLPKFGFEL